MYEQKTLPTEISVLDFLEGIENKKKRQEAYTLLNLIRDITGEEAVLWKGNIIGFGEYSYRYASGHSGRSFLFGFSPRKSGFSLYTATGESGIEERLYRLGRHRMGKACLYVNHLDDIDLVVLGEIITASVTFLREQIDRKA
ncbi:MAG: DUF1801 domain-containing protein [Sphaerochaetaceae bacterium]|nr:DUF1801 domain-containing protein [Sphaerochaetaceae bacterium]